MEKSKELVKAEVELPLTPPQHNVGHLPIMPISDKAAMEYARQTFCPTLNMGQFWVVNKIVQEMGFNMMTGEFYAWTDNKGLCLSPGVEAYLKRAKQDVAQKRVIQDVIREGDKFEYNMNAPTAAEMVSHTHNFFGKGKIAGAYCILEREGFPPCLGLAKWEEHFRPTASKRGIWYDRPETMIKKQAVKDCLKKVYSLDLPPWAIRDLAGYNAMVITDPEDEHPRLKEIHQAGIMDAEIVTPKITPKNTQKVQPDVFEEEELVFGDDPENPSAKIDSAGACEKCGAEVPGNIVGLSMANLGRILCLRCYNAEMTKM